MKTCPHCGTANPGSPEFCMNCRGGLRLRGSGGDSDLSAVDWVLCVLCSGVACITGIVYLIQGRPKGGKMIGFAILFAVLWTGLRVLLTLATDHR